MTRWEGSHTHEDEQSRAALCGRYGSDDDRIRADPVRRDDLFPQFASTGPLAYVAAALPAFPIICVFALIGRYMVEERDEYLRMLLVRQSLIATAFALTVATVWGFLENFGLVPHVDSYFAAILWFAGLGLGSCANKFWPGRAA